MTKIFEQLNRRERRFKERINYFEDLDELELTMRFRLSKGSVLIVLENIREELEFSTNKNKAISPMEQLLLNLCMYATGSSNYPNNFLRLLNFEIQLNTYY